MGRPKIHLPEPAEGEPRFIPVRYCDEPEEFPVLFIDEENDGTAEEED